MAVLVDSNVILDIVGDDPVWGRWSQDQLREARLDRGSVLINDVVYAEISVSFGSSEDIDRFLTLAGIELAPIPRPALFLAARAHKRYRDNRGTRTGVLPDFFIGARASVAGYELITRDLRHYRAYFPRVNLIAPHAAG